MLRGGSLFYALAIAVIIALVSSSLLLSAEYARMRIDKDEFREEVIRNAKSGMELLMDNQSSFAFDVSQEVDLFGNGNDSVLLRKKNWGAFEIGISKAHNKSFTHELIAEIGWQENKNDKTALILADLDRPLSICGETELRGDCYLPKAGIERAYIEGKSYSGNQLVYGETKIADRFLPHYNDSLVKRIQQLFEFHPGENDSVIFSSTPDSIANSFEKKPLYVFSETAIILDSKNISGQVYIISKKSIRVERNVSIHNAILLAPKIQIDNEVDGDFQAFARDSVIIGKKVHLRYPSILGIIATDQSPDFAGLILGEESKIGGQLFACSTANDFRKHVCITTEKESLVYGEIYSSDLVDHKGKISGDVVCSKFELKTASAEYENHLLDAVIDRIKRSPDFISSALTDKTTERKNIVQWLR